MMIEEKPIPEDLSWVRLRPLDQMECEAAGLTAAEAIQHSMANDAESAMVCIDGEPVCFWGYNLVGIIPYAAYAWMLTLEHMDGFSFKLARSSKRVVDYILTKAPMVVVTTHIKHEPACKWLTWLGFTPLYEPEANGFQHMVKRRG